MPEELVEVEGHIEAETDAAFLFDDGTTAHWLPKSKADFTPIRPGSDEGVMVIPRWLALDRGLI
jgi:hypothetical protein